MECVHVVLVVFITSSPGLIKQTLGSLLTYVAESPTGCASGKGGKVESGLEVHGGSFLRVFNILRVSLAGKKDKPSPPCV
nr:MAG TPA: hypothetical protein [Caudoviricetes sp.]